MNEREARNAIESAGFAVVELLEESDGVFIYLCKNNDGTENEVVYDNGNIVVAPT